MSTAAKKAPSTTPSVAGSSQGDVLDRVEKLETRTKAVNTNNAARVANSQLFSADDKLHPLYSLKTNRPVDRFPATSKDIAKLSEPLVDAMLLALEVDRAGNKQQKVERLRLQIGLKPNPA